MCLYVLCDKLLYLEHHSIVVGVCQDVVRIDALGDETDAVQKYSDFNILKKCFFFELRNQIGMSDTPKAAPDPWIHRSVDPGPVRDQ